MIQKTVLGPVKQSFIPLVTGILALEGLGVQGFPAVPIYLITAETARKVIDRLEPDLQRVGSAQSLKQFSKHTFQQTASENSKSAQVDAVKLPVASSPIVPYQIVHTIPGRIRFRVPRIAHDRAYARRLERLARLDFCIKNVRINCAAASIAITYQSGKASNDKMQSSFARLIQAASEAGLPIDSTVVAETPLTTLEIHSQGAMLPNSTVAATQPMTQERVNEAVALDIDLTHHVPAITAVHLSPSSESISLWADLKPPALFVILAFMANLV